MYRLSRVPNSPQPSTVVRSETRSAFTNAPSSDEIVCIMDRSTVRLSSYLQASNAKSSNGILVCHGRRVNDLEVFSRVGVYTSVRGHSRI